MISSEGSTSARGGGWMGSMDRNQSDAIMELPTVPQPKDADVASPQAAVEAVYASISGPAEKEEARDWDRLRALFLPDARFVLVRWQNPEKGSETVLRQWDVEGFIEAAKGFYEDSSFYEKEIASHIDRFGNIAHVFSTYESKIEEDGDPVSRGINSIQLVKMEGRWWIAHLVWDVETAANPIPDDYAGT